MISDREKGVWFLSLAKFVLVLEVNTAAQSVNEAAIIHLSATPVCAPTHGSMNRVEKRLPNRDIRVQGDLP
jgi:hypothetical protein